MTSDDASTFTTRAAAGGFVVILVALGIGIVVARPAAAPDDLSILASIILGLVEGLTEYLPVSSTGHLLVTQDLLGLGGTDSADLALDTYAICIQAGAILAVVVLYRDRLLQMARGVTGGDADGRRLLGATIAAFVLTVVIALLFQDLVRDRLFGPVPIAIAWIAGGIGVLALVRTHRLDRPGLDITELSLKSAAVIGVAQAFAIWPGVSRSLVTIVAAVLVGLSLGAAVEFSFILGLATLSAATAYEAIDNGSNLIDTFGIASPIIGLIVAFLSALLAIRWMVGWLEQRGFGVFGWYRIVAGLVVVLFLLTGVLD
ncbi:MAG: undecaprenyl-diphosphate phosphatase [Actinomycetota bacterium]